MANYCTAADVQAKVQSTTFADGPTPTKPSLTNVEDFCLQITADMNQRMLGFGIPVPVPASKADYLRRIAIYGVLADVYDAMDTEPAKAEMFTKQYEDAMTFIGDNHHMMETEAETPAPPEGTSPDREESPFPEDEERW